MHELINAALYSIICVLGLYAAWRMRRAESRVEKLEFEIREAWKEFDHPEFRTWSTLAHPCRIAMKAWWDEYRRQHPAPDPKKFA